LSHINLNVGVCFHKLNSVAVPLPKIAVFIQGIARAAQVNVELLNCVVLVRQVTGTNTFAIHHKLQRGIYYRIILEAGDRKGFLRIL